MKRNIVCLPYSGIPDVRIGEWHVEDGAAVVVGQLICTLVGKTPVSQHPILSQMNPAEVAEYCPDGFGEETLDIESTCVGVLRRVARENTPLEVGAVLFETSGNGA